MIYKVAAVQNIEKKSTDRKTNKKAFNITK